MLRRSPLWPAVVRPLSRLQAVLLGAAAVLVPVLIESMMRDGIKNALVIDSTDSPGYAAWQDGRNPQAGQVYYNMYTYNVTNAEGVLRGEVPVLEEVGPFVYQRIKVSCFAACLPRIARLTERPRQVRENVTWNEDATEVCFDPWSFYVPVDPDSEVGRAAGAVSHDLNITTVNMAFQALVETVGQKASWVLPVLYDKHSDLETMFVTRSSTDILCVAPPARLAVCMFVIGRLSNSNVVQLRLRGSSPRLASQATPVGTHYGRQVSGATGE